jgi:uncharacterized protein YodC (DUF2158 family)
MTEIKKGDVVGLKSGGAAMTVESLGDYSPTGPEDGVACVWYEDKKIVRDVFDRASLRVLDM